MATTKTDLLLPSSLKTPSMAGCAASSSQLPTQPKNQFSISKFFKLMKYERLRLITYLLYGHQWPKMDAISPSELAKAGFFYLHDDAVQCTFCRGIIRDWECGDEAMEEHKRHFPSCPFVRGEYCGNMPIEIDPDINSEKSTHSTNFADQSDGVGQQNSQMNPYNKSDMPTYPQFSEPSMRSYSFFNSKSNWRSEFDCNLLVDAGFFYTGRDDHTRCYHCGGLLFKWKPNENPLEEHARFFPECYFMISNRGKHYIEYVQFKTQIIELRQKMDSPQAVKNKDIDCMRKISYENFLNMKQSAYRAMNKLERGNHKTDTNSTYQRYLNKQFFLVDCQKLFQYLQSLDIMKPSSPTLESSPNSSQNSSSSSQTLNSSIFSLDDNESGNDNQSTKSSSDEETDENGNAKRNSKTNLTCIICCDRQIEIVFVPCGHQMSCRKCSDKFTDCPICRLKIDNKVRTFFAH